jgi:hypothetical protein
MAEHGAIDHPVQELVKDVKEETQQQPHESVVYVEAQAHRGGKVSYQRFHDSIGAERVFGQGVLGQADEGSNKQTLNLASPHQRKVDDHQQRHLEEAEELEE